MIELVVFLALLAAGWILWRGGKRRGSRQGYHVGRQHGRRRR